MAANVLEYQALRTVRLYGKLGTLFGRVHRLAVASPREAMRALCVIVPGFERFMLTSNTKGLEFAVFVDKTNIGESELAFEGKGDIRIAPVMKGSKRGGVLQTIIGVVLIAASFIPGFQALLAPGIALAAGGVVQMLSPQSTGLKGREDPDNKPSYAGGPVNTTAMGNPVGILAGRRRIGGAIISAGIYAEDVT